MSSQFSPGHSVAQRVALDRVRELRVVGPEALRCADVDVADHPLALRVQGRDRRGRVAHAVDVVGRDRPVEVQRVAQLPVPRERARRDPALRAGRRAAAGGGLAAGRRRGRAGRHAARPLHADPPGPLAARRAVDVAPRRPRPARRLLAYGDVLAAGRPEHVGEPRRAQEARLVQRRHRAAARPVLPLVAARLAGALRRAERDPLSGAGRRRRDREGARRRPRGRRRQAHQAEGGKDQQREAALDARVSDPRDGEGEDATGADTGGTTQNLRIIQDGRAPSWRVSAHLRPDIGGLTTASTPEP